MTPELREHGLAFVEDCAADRYYIGRHRPDHASTESVWEIDARRPAPRGRWFWHFPAHAAPELPAAPESSFAAGEKAVSAHPPVVDTAPQLGVAAVTEWDGATATPTTGGSHAAY